jgi:hypothetical protein
VRFARNIAAWLAGFFRPLAVSWIARLLFLLLFLLPAAAVLIPVVILPVTSGPVLQVAPPDDGPKRETPIAPTGPDERKLAERFEAMKAEEAFLTSRTELAKGDLVGLIIDLREGKATMVIKGVPVRVCPIAAYRIGGLTKGMRTPGFVALWTGQPFLTQSQSGTVVKKPIRIKEAPKDEKEYEAQSSAEAEPIEEGDVHCVLEFDRGLTVILEQTQADDWPSRWKQFRYEFSQSYETARHTLRGLMAGKLPEHRVFIELKLSRDDVKSIYRSIPEDKAGMALRL